MNILIFSKNYENYVSGYYHQDLIDSLNKLHNTYIYGPGYKNYSSDLKINDVIKKAAFFLQKIDLIIVSTSWDDDKSDNNVNPCPEINFLDVENIKKVYFLNKEYKKLNLRFKYIKENSFDCVVTVHPNYNKWEKLINTKFFKLPFGISLDRFCDLGLNRKYDFGFSGGLHQSHNDYRFLVKKKLFNPKKIRQKSNKGLPSLFKKNPFKSEYSKYNFFWAEWGARNYNLRSLLPKGKNYVYLLNKCKVFLNTPSAIGIINTRFYELMATKTLIFCPFSNQYGDLLNDMENCIMFKDDMSDFDIKFRLSIDNEELRERIVDRANKDVKRHSYDSRITDLTEKLIKFFELD